jgi:hypothetical protein
VTDEPVAGQRRTRARRRAAALVVSLATVLLAACSAAEQEPGRASAAPDACVGSADATRDSVEGTPVWARFCPGSDRYAPLAEVPSDALTTHLDLLDGLDDAEPGAPAPEAWCEQLSVGRTYEVQIGYADGRVATVAGSTDPECAGRLPDGGLVRGPGGLGVYGVVMTAFGRQYADGFDDSADDAPLVCPDDPGNPDSVDVDGASASLDTGFAFGEPGPMVMPLEAVRGIACTWPYGAEQAEPVVRELTPGESERVRIGLHAIRGGMVDCTRSPEPTRTAVVEDRTGTRRAVTIQDWICSSVIRSDGVYGLGFAWLDR